MGMMSFASGIKCQMYACLRACVHAPQLSFPTAPRGGGGAVQKVEAVDFRARAGLLCLTEKERPEPPRSRTVAALGMLPDGGPLRRMRVDECCDGNGDEATMMAEGYGELRP
eukprot:gene16879-biopygen11033